MMNDYFLQILVREREREILKEVRRCGYQARRRRRGSGLSKGIEGRLLSALKRLKTITGPRQKLQQTANTMKKISDPMLSLTRNGIDNDMGSSWN